MIESENMHDRFLNALNPTSIDLYIAKNDNLTTNAKLNTSTKKYKFRNNTIKAYENCEIPKPNSVFIICTASCNKKKICKIKINVNLEIKTIITYFQMNFESNLVLSFFQVKNYIFADSNFFEELKTYVYKKPVNKLCNYNIHVNMFLYFYDGLDRNYEMKIETIVYDNDYDFSILEYYERNITCKACMKNTSTKNVLDNPIVPYEKRFLCTCCFDELFRDDNGELKYKGMQYMNIQ